MNGILSMYKRVQVMEDMCVLNNLLELLYLFVLSDLYFLNYLLNVKNELRLNLFDSDLSIIHCQFNWNYGNNYMALDQMLFVFRYIKKRISLKNTTLVSIFGWFLNLW